MLRNLAATAPRLHVRDDRETPLFMRRDARSSELIWAEEEAGYFGSEGWTGRIGLKAWGKLVFASGRVMSAQPAVRYPNKPLHSAGTDHQPVQRD
jgi:hypothetical protein